MEISFGLCVIVDKPNFSKQVSMNKDICEYFSLIQISKNDVSHVQQYLANWVTSHVEFEYQVTGQV
jgi:hypothetical protein